MGAMTDATSDYVLLDGLKALAARLSKEIDECTDNRELAGLSRQYRETMVKIDEIEGGPDDEDAVAAIINRIRQSASD